MSESIVALSGTGNKSSLHADMILFRVSSPYLTLIKDLPPEFNFTKSVGFSRLNTYSCSNSFISNNDSLPPTFTKIGINHLTPVVSFSPLSRYHSCLSFKVQVV